jgi:hypothetical protein
MYRLTFVFAVLLGAVWIFADPGHWDLLRAQTAGYGLVNTWNGPQPLASQPVCTAAGQGMRAAVTDSQSANWGTTVTGGGSNHVLAYCDGTVAAR